ncbi:hypothetical protein V6N12_024354 [Hibiscus sabdariffa]|uniref:Transmembrane protein n=1 Tax=Hibiscus sabdariffa TaxID=183260 RepID=A0ABR2G0I5_9ROSI
MATTRHIPIAIFLYLLFMSLAFPVSNAAIYRNKHKDSKMIGSKHHLFIYPLTKGAQIPPSGPSKRHNVLPNGNGHGSTKHSLNV